ARRGGDIRLQESCVGFKLRRQQKGDAKDVLALGEALADALFFGERVRHEHSDSRLHGPSTTAPGYDSRKPGSPLPLDPYGKMGFLETQKPGDGQCRCPRASHARSYLTSTLAPASSSFFLTSSAVALSTPSLMGLGAPSTRSFASFRPRPVSSRTALMTDTLLAPASASTTVNSVCSSAAAAAPPAAAGAATATAAAAADTPNFSSISLISSDSSSTVMPAMASRISALLSAIFQELQIGNARVWLSLRSSEFRLGCPSGGLFLVAHGGQAAHELGRNFVERTYELRDRGLQGAQQLREQLFTGRHGGQGLHAGFVQQAVGQRAALDDQLVVALCETGKHLGRRHRILADRIDQ